ncbi:MAG: hypothetical protein ABW137_14705 [Mycobacterium sp.]
MPQGDADLGEHDQRQRTPSTQNTQPPRPMAASVLHRHADQDERPGALREVASESDRATQIFAKQNGLVRQRVSGPN